MSEKSAAAKEILKRRKARSSLLEFTQHTKKNYQLSGIII
jgi:hypothetical protein